MVGFLGALALVAGAASVVVPRAERAALPGASVLEGRRAAVLVGRKNTSFRAYAAHGGKVEPIPFQVDERDPRDRWIAERGPHPNLDDAVGVFDDNDGIVFMNSDLGDRALPRALPKGASRWAEVRIGTSERPLGWIYVGTFAEPPPPSGTDLVRYDAARNRAYGQSYAIGIDAPLPTHVGFVDRLGELGENHLGALRVRGEARILGNLIRLKRTEEDIQATIYSHKDGPVRAIRRGQYWIRLPLGFRARGKVDLLFYRDFVAGEAIAKIRIPPRLVPADGDLTAYFDFIGLDGARLLAGGDGPAPIVDGKMSRGEVAARGDSRTSATLLLPDGRAFLLAIRREGALAKLDQSLFYEDRARDGKAPGGRPSFGFQLSGVGRLETGEHKITVTGMILPNGDPEVIRLATRMLLEPPSVAASELAVGTVESR